MVSTYIGGGALAGMAAEMNAETRQEREQQRQQERKLRYEQKQIDEQLTNKAESLPQPPTNASGSPGSTNTKGNGEKSELATSDGKSGEVLDPKQEAIKLLEKLLKQKTPSSENLNHLHDLIVSTPDVWWLASIGMLRCWSSVVDKTSSGVVNALQRAEMDILKKKMDYDNSSPLEQMHIDHVLTAQLRLRNAENNFNSKILGEEGFSFEGARFWQDFLEIRATSFSAGERIVGENPPTRPNDACFADQHCAGWQQTGQCSG